MCVVDMQMDVNQAVEARNSLSRSQAAAVSTSLHLQSRVTATQQAFLKYQVSVTRSSIHNVAASLGCDCISCCVQYHDVGLGDSLFGNHCCWNKLNSP